VYGPDDALYATVHRDGDPANGAVVRLADGEVTIYAQGMISPVGLAFQPGTAVLYVSARETPTEGGGLYRIDRAGAAPVPVVGGLPCCWREIDNQVNGMIFGPDGWLYLGVSSLTDHAEPPDPQAQAFREMNDREAAVLRIQPHTGQIEVYARGIRHPFDLTFQAGGAFYATDSGVISGPGDRLLRLMPDAHYQFPYWRAFGCVECPPTRADLTYADTLLPLPDYTLPRGIVAYTGTAFPSNLFNGLFVALWHDNEIAPAVVYIDPDDIPTDAEDRAAYQPTPFITGLLRPIDMTISADGDLVVADWATGHIWQVSYTG